MSIWQSTAVNSGRSQTAAQLLRRKQRGLQSVNERVHDGYDRCNGTDQNVTRRTTKRMAEVGKHGHGNSSNGPASHIKLCTRSTYKVYLSASVGQHKTLVPSVTAARQATTGDDSSVQNYWTHVKNIYILKKLCRPPASQVRVLQTQFHDNLPH